MSCPYYQNFCTRKDTPDLLVLNWCNGNSYQMCDIYSRLERQRNEFNKQHCPSGLVRDTDNEIENDDFCWESFGMGFVDKPFRVEGS